MDKVLVSVIVPIYNVEYYIERCVSSLINQNHSHLEIILVDDGSPDNSGKIIDRMSETDDRIVVIHKQNGGVSSARNAGLDVAHGEYVMFVDGDDYVDPDYVSYFLDMAISNHCDIAMNVSNYTYKAAKADKKDHQRIIDAFQAIEYIYIGKLFVAVWNKIYKRSLLTKNGIKFDPDYWYGEGMLFNIVCLQYVDKVAIGERKVYHQEYNPDSAMRSFNLKSNHCGIRSLERQKELWIKKNKRIEDAWNYHYRCFSYSILLGLTKINAVEEHKEEYQRCIKNLRANITMPLKVDIGIKHKLIHMLIACLPVLMAKIAAGREAKIARQKKAQQTNQE